MSKSRSGAPRRIAAGLVASALSVVGIALAPPAGAVDDVSTDRVAGINRYATAAAVAGQDDFDGASTAILATGETFPDALAASGLAGAQGPAPIILTESDVYSDEAQEALNNLTSITDVTIVGGTAAISEDVADDVEADGFTVTRIAGTDRYGTAAEVAGEIGAGGTIGGLSTAFIATGTGFADALAGGPLAYALGAPILLVTPSEIPAATEAALGDLGIEQVVILGGTAAVGEDVADELESLTGNAPIRVAGENRFGTAAEVLAFAQDTAELAWAPTEVLVTSGLNFPDALAGGPLGGERQAPILLSASCPAELTAALDENSDVIEDVTFLGGTGAVDEETADCVEEATENVENDDDTDTPTNATATTRPELVSATIVETRVAASQTANRPAGTYVLYCFDEPITGAAIAAGGTNTTAGSQFFLYSSDGTRFASTGTENTAGVAQTFTSGVSSTDNKCAEVIFGGAGAGAAGSGALDTAAEAANLTLATVNDGAVTGAAGAATDTNIEGDAPLTPASGTAAAAGVTAAPDLVSVGNFRAGSTIDVTAVDFTFDAPAFARPGALYQIIGTDGRIANCQGPAAGSTTASGLAAPGGEGTTVHTVNCNDPVAAVAGAFWTAENTARGMVHQGSVASSAAGANPNPLEAAPVANSGNSIAPDLTLVVFSPDAVVGSDVVSYLFDEAVTAGGGGGGVYATSSSFGIYNSAGGQVQAPTCVRSSESSAVVSCFFADNTLSGATYVGGNVNGGAVTDTDADGPEVGLAAATPNGADEEGVAPSTAATSTAGRTDGPELLSVTINTVVSPFGNTTFTATYNFDEDTAATGTAGTEDGSDAAAGGNSNGTVEDVMLAGLHLYTADGIRLDCASLGLPTATAVLGARASDAQDDVTCTSYVVGGTATAATAAQVQSAVVGTNDYGAVDDEAAGGDTSPEGAALTTGGNGTPRT